MLKFVLVLTFVAIAAAFQAQSYQIVKLGNMHGAHYSGGYGGHHDAGHYNGHHGDHYSSPNYSFDYGVKDAHTGDNKKQWETRHGDVVKGGYMLDEADGTKRVVEYTADKHHGFNAIVKKIGHAHHPQTYAKHWDGYHDGHHGGYYGGYNHGHNHGHAATSYSYLYQH